eukprot:7411527-Pyramimonas_sp.AAC.1
MLYELHGLRAGSTDSHPNRTKHGVLESTKQGVLARSQTVRTQQSGRSVARKSREQCFGMLRGLQAGPVQRELGEG